MLDTSREYSSYPSNPATKDVQAQRAAITAIRAPEVRALREDPTLRFEECSAPGPHGDIPVTVVRPAGSGAGVGGGAGPRPGIVFYHAGGGYVGDVFYGVDAQWVAELGAVLAAVDYRLAPEHRGPVLVEDCYAALLWVGDNAARLGIDPGRLVLAGASAGGGLAAGTAMMARDQGGPRLCGLLLKYPMLDDRSGSVSSRQFADSGTYNGRMNQFSWACILGTDAGGEGVSHYVAPGRATDLSGLPETFVDVGSAEPLRDEAVAFASGIWAAGGQAELHVWPGGTSGFSSWVPTADISKQCRRAALAWLRRRLVVKAGTGE
jgi:acetyl esterase/lipase